VSWQSHLGGAIGGVLSAFLFRNADPPAPRHRYSWELEEEENAPDYESPSSM
jgi:membrane associated rhomboid family serine protease